MNVPGLPVPVPVPVAHMDRPPEGDETQLFTWKPASEWDEHWVAIDVPAARKVANMFLDAAELVKGPSILDLVT